jgi:hypothetical protein
MQACALADLKYLGFKYASRLGFQSVSKIWKFHLLRT